MAEFASDSIMTFTGKIISPLRPDPALIDIVDIAHSLANQCRFTGHTSVFYSVAQHSVHVSEITDYENALWGLLHDASEAYLSDLARPIKNADGLGKVYRRAEQELSWAVRLGFGITAERWPQEEEDVAWADNVLLRTEMRDLMPAGISTASDYEGEFLDYNLTPENCWSPRDAEFNFLKRYNQLARRD